MVAALFLAACTSFPFVQPTTPPPMCTPPLCAANEAYACGAPSGQCPGGCGTICVTHTPDPGGAAPPSDTPAADTPPAGTAACALVVRTPAPEAPTASVNGTPDPNRRVDPHVAVCASAARVPVGGTFTLLARAVDIGLPLFRVSARAAGEADFTPLADYGPSGQATPLPNANPIVALRSAQSAGSDLALTLEALAPGTVELVVSATGEIHWGYPGPATWGGGSSDVITVTVE